MFYHILLVVRVVGVEPTRLAAQEPKSCTSANSAIPAYIIICNFALEKLNTLPGLPQKQVNFFDLRNIYPREQAVK